MVWFGRLSAISQLASRVGVGQSLSLSYTTWLRWARAGKGVAFPPLNEDPERKFVLKPNCNAHHLCCVVGARNVARDADGAATEASPLHRQVQGDPGKGKGARLYVKMDSVSYETEMEFLNDIFCQGFWA
jgi:hypothetical protein